MARSDTQDRDRSDIGKIFGLNMPNFTLCDIPQTRTLLPQQRQSVVCCWKYEGTALIQYIPMSRYSNRSIMSDMKK